MEEKEQQVQQTEQRKPSAQHRFVEAHLKAEAVRERLEAFNKSIEEARSAGVAVDLEILRVAVFGTSPDRVAVVAKCSTAV